MSSNYIAFELDAFDDAEAAARAAGTSADVIMAGLLRLWRHCWRHKTDQVVPSQLLGIFGTSVSPALVAFGFLEELEAGFRVRGAERYLRIQKARSAGGKAASGNLKQNQKPPKKPTPELDVLHQNGPADDRLATGSPPADPPAEDRAFQRTANSELNTLEPSVLKAGEPAREKPPPKKSKFLDPRHGPLIGRLKKSYLELVGQACTVSDADANALKNLLTKADDDEIDRRWRKGLEAGQFETKCSCVLELAQRWNALAIDRGKPGDWLRKRNLEQAEKHVEGEFKL
jgi:hypothetical protein